MKAQQEKAIRQAVADIFLSDGSYEDLERLADGTRPHGQVSIWEPLEHMSYEDILDAVDSAVSHVMKAMSEPEFKPEKETYKFPRRCDITGKGMWEGYCFGDGQDYAIDKAGATTLAMQYGYDTLEEAFEDGAYYFTSWYELDEDEWFESLNEDGSNAYAVSSDEG